MPEDVATILTSETVRKVGGLVVEPVSEQDTFINILIYGPPGVGKTVLAGSASAVPEMGPVLLVDIEGGSLSLTHSYPNVDVVRVKTWDEMQKVYDELHKGTTYKTIILDSLTEIQKFSMQQIMAQLMREEPGRDPDIAGQREWGKNIEQTRKFVRAFRDLEVNTIFTALAQADKDPRTGLMLTKPSLNGKVANEVAGFLDIVCYYYMKMVDGEQKRLLLTQATDSQVAKDRSGKLPPVVESPTMSKLFQLITGGEAE